MFRAEALKAQQGADHGAVILIRPLSVTVLTCLASAIAIAIISMLIFGSYTTRSTVAGNLVPDLGLAKVYATQPGIVIRKEVSEGQLVAKGQTLFTLSSERRNTAGGNIQAEISKQLAARRSSMIEEKENLARVHLEDRRALEIKIAALESELARVNKQQDLQISRTGLSEKAFLRYKDLADKNYISSAQVQQKEEDWLDQKSRIESLARDKSTLKRELDQQKMSLATIQLRQQNELAQIDRNITALSQDLEESESKRELQIVAPQSGLATSINAEVGQSIEGNKPMVSIMPAGSTLTAHLYVPSRAIGFIRPGSTVQLRYQAFPYQKFGKAEGVVISVARTAESSSDITSLTHIPGFNGTNSEPMYVVRVKLRSQTVQAYGVAQPLQAGMLLEADILQENRRLYEWVLEPLYSITGKL